MLISYKAPEMPRYKLWLYLLKIHTHLSDNDGKLNKQPIKVWLMFNLQYLISP